MSDENSGLSDPNNSENLPEKIEPGVEPHHRLAPRQGMFGNSGSGDTSGYGRLVNRVPEPQQANRPYGSYYDEVVDLIEAAIPGAIERVIVHRGDLTIYVVAPRLAELAKVLRDEPKLRFEGCLSVSGVHYPGDVGNELHAVYELLSMTHNRRIRLEASCSDAHPHLPSVVATYPAADWHEREAWDMFGIIFDGHPSLTRILMPDDWPGHPQRKDYPLGGVPVEYKGATIAPPDQRRSYS